MQFRKADLGKLDLETRTVPVVIATDAPYQRAGYVEVLDLSKVDLSRGDLPLIESHDTNQLNIGVVRKIRVEGNKLRGIAVFGKSARATEILEDVQAGIITGVSIGYQLTDEGTPFKEAGPLGRKFGFMPFEASVVAVPADPTAGFFRSGTITLNRQSNLGTIMETVTTPSLTTETRNHANEIGAIAKSMPGHEQLALRSIQAGHTVEQFQAEAIRALANKPIATAYDRPKGGDTPVSTPLQILRSASEFKDYYAGRVAAGSDAIGLTHFLRGVARMQTTAAVSRALSVGVDASGGFTVPSVVMPEILAALSPASSLMQAGAGIVPLIDGAKSYSFAAVDTLPTASWRLENGLVSESGPTFKNILVTPRSLSFVVKVSRELLADALNIDGALQQAIAQAFAKEIDRVGLRGSGSAPEPRGLLSTTGVQSVTNGANGAILNGYANMFSGVQAILAADAAMPSAAIMSPRSQVKFGALVDTTGQPLLVPTMLQGVRMGSTSQIPNNLTVGTSTDCSEIYLGDFSKMAFAMRENLSVQVLEEAFADYGQIGFMCHARADIVVLYPQAFAVVTGVR